MLIALADNAVIEKIEKRLIKRLIVVCRFDKQFVIKENTHATCRKITCRFQTVNEQDD